MNALACRTLSTTARYIKQVNTLHCYGTAYAQSSYSSIGYACALCSLLLPRSYPALTYQKINCTNPPPTLCSNITILVIYTQAISTHVWSNGLYHNYNVHVRGSVLQLESQNKEHANIKYNFFSAILKLVNILNLICINHLVSSLTKRSVLWSGTSDSLYSPTTRTSLCTSSRMHFLSSGVMWNEIPQTE